MPKPSAPILTFALVLAGAGTGGLAQAHDGHPATPAAAPVRTISVRMDDHMRFTPATIQVRQGETIRLALENAGQLPHEMAIGPLPELLAHARMMREHPDMPAHHEANALTLAPGAQGTLDWTFDTAGRLDFACLIPGHREAGMAGHFEIAADAG